MDTYWTASIFLFILISTSGWTEARRAGSSKGGKDGNTSRGGKLLSMFNVVQFPNDACEGDSGKNGTCYTASECHLRDGTSAGGCAEGYGVCCTFVRNCGITTNENNTYFESEGSEVGSCSLRVCKSNLNVCQLRLDLNTFMIAQPSASSLTSGMYKGLAVASRSVCANDQFIVTSPGNPTPPVICGTNNLEHMYVDASALCNDLTMVIGTQSAIARSWEIKVTQYTCEFENRAPTGCTQYFYNTAATGVIKTFNFDGGQHLANQKHKFCIRRERSMCGICYTTGVPTDFQTSKGSTSTAIMTRTLLNNAGQCCGTNANVPTADTKSHAYDCLVVPGAVSGGTPATPLLSEFCGNNNLFTAMAGNAGGTAGASVCTTRVPFEVTFYSDGFEYASGALAESSQEQAGVNLIYRQQAC